MTDQPAKVSIVIPAWEERSSLPIVLNALANQHYPLDRIEVICVAGGPDATLREARRFDGRVFSRYHVIPQEDGEGRYGALLRGLQHSSADILVFLDADTIISESWLECVVSAIATGYDAVNGDYFPIGDENCFTRFPMIEKEYVDQKGQPRLYGGGTIAVHRRIFEEHPPEHYLSGSIHGADDVVLMRRLLAEGFRIGIAEKAAVRTALPSSFIAILRDWKRWYLAYYTAIATSKRTQWSHLFRSVLVVAAPIMAIFLAFQPLSILGLLLMSGAIVATLIFGIRVSERYMSYGRAHNRKGPFLGFLALHYCLHWVRVVSLAERIILGKSPPVHYKGDRRAFEGRRPRRMGSFNTRTR